MSPCYNVPAPLIDSFQNQTVIIRSHDPSELVEALGRVDRDKLCYMELTSLNSEPNVFWELDRRRR